MGFSSHCPLLGLQAIGLQGSPSEGHRTAVPSQLPSTQTSFVVHRSPSSQAPPVSGLLVHAPVVVSQMA